MTRRLTLLLSLVIFFLSGCGDSGPSVTITGVTLGLDATNITSPLEGVTVYTVAGGVRKEATSDANGGWALKGLPYQYPGTNQVLDPVFLFFEKSGWVYDGDPNDTNATAPAVAGDGDFKTGDGALPYQNYFAVDLGSVGTRTDVGPVTLFVGDIATGTSGSSLQVTSNLVHATNGAAKVWFTTTQGDIGDATLDSNVYLADATANITLTFNHTVDTAYSGTDFVELYAPDGTAVAYTGSWDTTGTVFTVDPTADLAADNNDLTKHHLRLARAVRAYDGVTSQLMELSGINIWFNVLSSAHDALLATQAPILLPAADSKTAYVFDSAVVRPSNLLPIGLEDAAYLEDFTATQTTAQVNWPEVAGAVSYQLYYRNMKDNTAGQWTTTGAAQLSSAAGPDGTFTQQVTVYAIGLTGTDALLTGGEEIQLAVTVTDADGNESSINALNAPLSIMDTYGPMVSNATYTVDLSPLAEADNTVVKADLTVTFTENMDTRTVGAAPVIASLGALVSVDTTAADAGWTSVTNYEWLDSQLTFNAVMTTTIPGAVAATDSTITVADASTFMEGDTVLIYPASEVGWITRTINDIETATKKLTLNTTVGRALVAGATVRLQSNALVPGLTALRATVASDVAVGDTAITLSTGGGALYNATLRPQDGTVSTPIGTARTFAGLTAGRDYYVGVTASVNAVAPATVDTESAPGPMAGGTPGAPTFAAGATTYAPQNISVQVGAASVVLNWTAANTPETAGYAIYRSTVTGANSGTSTLLASVANTVLTYTDLTAVNGTVYYYVVQSKYTVAPVPALTKADDSLQVIARPAAASAGAPTLVTATPGATSVALTWTAGVASNYHSAYLENPQANWLTMGIWRSDSSTVTPVQLTNLIAFNLSGGFGGTLVSGDVVALNSPATENIPAGALVILGAPTLAEPGPRATKTATLTSEVLFDGTSAILEFGAGLVPTGILVGDTVIVEPDGSTTTVTDRITGTISAFDTVKDTVTIATTVAAGTNMALTTTSTVRFMGDALTVTGAVDSNGNAMQTTYGHRVNPNGGTVR